MTKVMDRETHYYHGSKCHSQPRACVVSVCTFCIIYYFQVSFIVFFKQENTVVIDNSFAPLFSGQIIESGQNLSFNFIDLFDLVWQKL